MNPRGKLPLLFLVAAIAVAALVLVFVLNQKVPRKNAALASQTSTSEKNNAERDASKKSSSAPTPGQPAAAAAVDQNTPEISRVIARIESALAALQKGDDSAAAALKDLRTELRRANPRDAIAAIMQFLASGRDASTGADFKIGAGGSLDDAPTLRVFLLDQIGQLARQTGSPEAAQVGREILQTKNSADEWALSLRNVAWSEQNSAPFLSAKFQEMLSYEPWLEKPSTGMLEAFDVAVYTKDTSLVPRLTELLRGSSVQLQQASGVALDRLAESAPLKVMNYLNSNPGALADRPLVRADYFSKADVSDPAQKQAIETYLARADVTASEKTKLLSAMAEPATFVSENLLTSAPAPQDENPARQQALAAAAAEWMNRFPELKPQLQRLQSHVSQ